MMLLAEHIVLPDDSTVRLAPGGVHVMLESLTRVILPGDSVAVTFVFRRSGRVNVMARVVAYDQIEQLLGASEAP
jgi:copper(I)-binding protein